MIIREFSKVDLSILRHLRIFSFMQQNSSDEKLPDYPWIRDAFNIHSTLSYTKHYMGKFSSLQDVNNGFILDGILGDYKEGELPLAQQHLVSMQKLCLFFQIYKYYS